MYFNNRILVFIMTNVYRDEKPENTLTGSESKDKFINKQGNQVCRLSISFLQPIRLLKIKI